METRIFIVMGLTFLITMIGTLAYSIRIVGVRTGKIAISFALFNIAALASRTANTIQGPMLTKYVESNVGMDIVIPFYFIIGSAVLASIIGIITIPSFQRIFSRGVEKFSIERSVPKIIIHGFSKSGIKQFKSCIALPSKNTIKEFNLKNLPKKIIFYNIIVIALMVVGSLAPIYAGSLEPSLRATCLSLSGIINGIATVLLFVFVDPFLSIATDDVIEGKAEQSIFRKYVIGMAGAKVVGTMLAIPLLIPAAKLIVLVADSI